MKSLAPEYYIELWAGILLPRESKGQPKSQKKTSQNYLKAIHFDCKCVLLILSKLYKSIKDCIIAEDMVAALRNRRKLEFWSWINCCWNP